MATANDRLRDFEVSHQISLLRVSNRETREMFEALARVDERLTALIARTGTTRFSRDRARRIRGNVRDILKTQTTIVRDGLAEAIRRVAGVEQEIQLGAVARALNAGQVGISLESVPVGQLVAAIRSTPFEGSFLTDFISRLERNDVDRVSSQIIDGIVSGDPTEAIVRRVTGSPGLRFKDGSREVTRRGIRGLVRTTLNHAATTARSQLFAANDDIISGELYVATLDGRTTRICGSLDGKIFPLGVGPRPPVHFQCRSVTTPVLKGLEDLPGQFRRASQDGIIDPADFPRRPPGPITYEEWLRGRSAAFQDDVLGRTKGALFRRGELPLGRFVNDAGRELTVDELRLRAPGAFAEAGLT